MTNVGIQVENCICGKIPIPPEKTPGKNITEHRGFNGDALLTVSFQLVEHTGPYQISTVSHRGLSSFSLSF
jgi:hypothetical protein